MKPSVQRGVKALSREQWGVSVSGGFLIFLFGRELEAARWTWDGDRAGAGRAGRKPALQAR